MVFALVRSHKGIELHFGGYGPRDDHKKEENLIFSLDHSLSLDFLNRIFGVCLTLPFLGVGTHMNLYVCIHACGFI